MLSEQQAPRGVEVHRATVSRFLYRLGLSNKKCLKASEQRKPEIAKARNLWIYRRKPLSNKALSRLIFIDETSPNTRLTKRTGWSRKGVRFTAFAFFGHWKSQSFIAALRRSLTGPWIMDATMNSRIFETWIETQLAPTLSQGDVVILNNVGFHRSECAERLVKERNAWLVFLPSYSPDLNPIEMAFRNPRHSYETSRLNFRCYFAGTRRHHHHLLHCGIPRLLQAA